jgi:hypothetical protein
MDDCAACGARVEDARTYCVDCARGETGDELAGRSDERSMTSRRDVVASPRARAVGVVPAVAAVLGGLAAVRSLVYVPEALAFFDPVDSIGFLLVQGVNVGVVLAFAVMARRLFDGTAATARYGRVLQGLAAASVSVSALVVALPDGITRWLPAVFDPGYVTLSVVARYLAPVAFSGPLSTFGLAVVGAALSFAAGSALRRTPAK